MTVQDQPVRRGPSCIADKENIIHSTFRSLRQQKDTSVDLLGEGPIYFCSKILLSAEVQDLVWHLENDKGNYFLLHLIKQMRNFISVN